MKPTTSLADPGPLAAQLVRQLSQDHLRLDALLGQAVARAGAVERAAYAAFRAGLLWHIRMEETILFPAAWRRRGGAPLPVAAQLKRDHAALAALLLPTPTPEIVETLRTLLHRHNAIEEGAGGVYAACERLLAEEGAAVAAELRAAPEVRVARHADGPRVKAHVRALVDRAYGRFTRDPCEDA